MTLEWWNTVFQVGSAVLLGFTFLFGAGAILTDRIINARQEARIASAQGEAAEANKRAAEAGAEAAAANERAAEANRATERERLARVQLERKIAPRLLSPEQQSKITSEIRKLAEQRATITWYSDSFEGAVFASHINSALKAASWKTDMRSSNAGVNNMPVVSGVVIMTEPNEGSITAGEVLLSALRNAGITAAVLPFEALGNRDAMRNKTEPENTRVLVVVGNHP